jgi:transcriptional regulator with XRE-family HTH domain
MALAAKLKELRLKKGLSLQELAEAVGASKAHIWDLEQGRAKNPTIEMLKALSSTLGTTIADLMGEDPSTTETDAEALVMFRDLKDLSPDDRETIKIMMGRLKKKKTE